MSFARRRLFLFATGLVALPLAYFRHRLVALEQAYPPLSPDETTTVHVRKPGYGTRPTRKLHTPHIDVYAANVPLAGLIDDDAASPPGDSSASSVEARWARTFLSSGPMQFEGRMFGKDGSSGDAGEQGFFPGQVLLSGVFTVVRPPGADVPLLVSWSMAPHVVAFFERIARWGYPWRLMDGGRHEMSVGSDDDDGRGRQEQEHELVQVRFVSAHDYALVDGEGRGEEGKVIPRWVIRLHRAYGRFLLDAAVKETWARARARAESIEASEVKKA